MSKAENKTKQTTASVKTFIDGIKDEGQRKDASALVTLMKRATGSTPRMWGPTIVGFGSYHYKYASGREGDYCVTGFSPRKGTLTLYIKQLSDVHLPTLETMVTQGVAYIKSRTPNVTM